MNSATQVKTSVTPRQLNQLLQEGGPTELIDVRTPGEFASGHVPGAKSIPLDDLGASPFLEGIKGTSHPVYVLCQSGGRARKAIALLEQKEIGGCVLVEGGTQAWMDAGLPVERSGNVKVLPLMQQVQIVIGLVSAVGAGLALTVDPTFALLPLITGVGLLFAGITGYCGLAMLLTKMPWNRASHCVSNSCCPSKGKA